LDYCRLWHAIITMDEAALEEIARRMHAPFHRIFASMLTARPWDQYVTQMPRKCICN